MSDHTRIDRHAGNGYTEPRESWVECSCGALIWEWQQFYNENTAGPDKAWTEHLQWNGAS